MINQWINAREFHHVFWAKQWRFQPSPAVLPIYGIAPAESASLTAGFRPSNGALKPRYSQKKPPARPSFSEDSIGKPMVWIRKRSINGGIFTTMLVAPFRLSIQLYIWNIHEIFWMSFSSEKLKVWSKKLETQNNRSETTTPVGKRTVQNHLFALNRSKIFDSSKQPPRLFHPLLASIFKLYPALFFWQWQPRKRFFRQILLSERWRLHASFAHERSKWSVKDA